ncbi:MAG: 1-deoxy-D-xylulose-5-phosphate reductoisomerase [Acidobacteria bacterium]|nr:MAG: 1-deoxy-D-xylulose-5-phosphate reductoisomerase [Acidobacteria bacterium 13_2_20CM_58_27]PYT89870.1 MAG: 1-deoxy-D-xylulose-5-phosphate reductoisomerase [Acidobacteriota bacterium]
MKQLAILGSTGSIGRQCLAVVESLPGRFGVVALAAGANLEELTGQIARLQPEVVSVADARRADDLAQRLGEKGLARKPEIHHGREGMLAVATHSKADVVVSAAVGVVGLEATYEAVKLGKTVALSNKEVLVAAGELVMAAAKKAGRELLPVDSEHNALHQCLRGGSRGEVRRLVLTASGGPFRETPLAQLESVTLQQALAHPNWRMGNRITIDSATMMNKGFEVIEAHWLFGVRGEHIEVLIHPQSTIHSMVEFVDGSVLAQLGPTDMRMPIQYALTYPERVASNQVALDWTKLKRLDFRKASMRRFPCLRLAGEAMRKGGAYPCALNAADEIAVSAFLEQRLPFLGIPEVIERVLSRTAGGRLERMEDVLTADAEARRMAQEEIAKVAGGVAAQVRSA